MSDLDALFRLLDLLLFHPGYVVDCSQCGEPISDLLGNVVLGRPIIGHPNIESGEGAVWHHSDGSGLDCLAWQRQVARAN